MVFGSIRIGLSVQSEKGFLIFKSETTTFRIEKPTPQSILSLSENDGHGVRLPDSFERVLDQDQWSLNSLFSKRWAWHPVPKRGQELRVGNQWIWQCNNVLREEWRSLRKWIDYLRDSELIPMDCYRIFQKQVMLTSGELAAWKAHLVVQSSKWSLQN
ncbi:hypothetical protein HPP92_026676 [Vanilla planifolia]|uniref:Uncharacterized protein n=1 Tax=Vanilla planifolia TaxID=51239 RepID=A0A835PEK3_VANPL|nr:hypothetical protein HPP92_026676 [Vanilla planifolia]